MIFYFEIEDRFGQRVPIDNPVGWDSTTFILERDRGGKHGVFFTFQANPYTYDGEAFRILKTEYDTFGVEGEMYLLISYDCGFGVEQLDKMRFVFPSYEETTGEMCQCTIPVETLNDALLLRNRIDQKVDLQATTVFNRVGALSAYTAAPMTRILPAKGVVVTDHSNNPQDNVVQYMGVWFDNTDAGDPGFPDYGLRQMLFSVPAYSVKISAEIGGYEHPINATPVGNLDITMQGNFDAPLVPGFAHLPYGNGSTSPDNSFDRVFPFEFMPPIVNYDASLGGEFGSINVTIEGQYKKMWASQTALGDNICGFEVGGVYLGILPAGRDPFLQSSWNWLSLTNSVFDFAPYNNGARTTTMSADFAFSFNVTLNPGDRIYYFDKIGYRKKDIHNTLMSMFITDQIASYFKTSGISKTNDTTVKLFMINEVFSKITEAITDGKYRVYSETLGRIDSQPYNVAIDGCFSFIALTMGAFIRELELKLPTRPPIFALSLNDVWSGVNPICNLGLGIEPDTLRPGFDRVRIETWRYFYENDVVLSCHNVPEIRRGVQQQTHASIFKFGYNKWEAEEFTGIDEFLTSREYRTTLTQINNTISQLSEFIASGFAIEVTRRKGNDTSEDWRYDKDTFLISMKRDGTNTLIVQQGDINSPNHITDPSTILNFRIRPSMIALNWLPQILASYRQAGFSSEIIFTDGKGNVYAEGQLSVANCQLSTGVISEKQDLSPNNLANPADGLPTKFLEPIVYEFPLSIDEWNLLRANPHKQIAFDNNETSGVGWIERVEFKINDGMANFTLIPAR